MMTIPVESLTGPAKRPEKAPPYFHVMAKPTGAICNLDCKYCFFLSKEALYCGSPFRMASDVMEAYVRQLIKSQQAPQVTIAWQGGEPTLMGQGRYADEIMFLYDAEEKLGFAKVGRNEPCPCGSGKKHKRCHGRRENIQTKTI
jgi:uncharacterized radical SAM superfamily Fe-S cluster-containing enzyme